MSSTLPSYAFSDISLPSMSLTGVLWIDPAERLRVCISNAEHRNRNSFMTHTVNRLGQNVNVFCVTSSEGEASNGKRVCLLPEGGGRPEFLNHNKWTD